MDDSARRTALAVIFLTVFIDLLGFGMVLPLLPIYARHFTASYTPEQAGWIVGLLMASFSAMQFLFLPIWGRLSDRVGRRPIVLLGLAGSVVFYALFGFATIWRSLAGLFVARIGAGIAGATIATAQAYIADVTPRDRRAAGMALIGAAFGLGFTLGPMIGGLSVLIDGGEFSPWPGFVAAILSAGAFVLAWTRLPEPERAAGVAHRNLFDFRALQVALATPSVGLLILTSFLTVIAFASFESTLSLSVARLVEQFDAGNVSSPLLGWLLAKFRAQPTSGSGRDVFMIVLVVFTYLGLTLTLSQGFLVRRLAKKLPEGVLATAGLIVATIGLMLLAWAAVIHNFGLLLFGLTIEVIGFSLVTPPLQSLISRRSDPTQQGAILGLGQSAASLSRILGPVIGIRLIADHPSWPYLVAAALMGIGFVLAQFAIRGGRDYPTA
jgi:MFS family permease